MDRTVVSLVGRTATIGPDLTVRVSVRNVVPPAFLRAMLAVAPAVVEEAVDLEAPVEALKQVAAQQVVVSAAGFFLVLEEVLVVYSRGDKVIQHRHQAQHPRRIMQED
jgi:hypothetical protein